MGLVDAGVDGGLGVGDEVVVHAVVHAARHLEQPLLHVGAIGVGEGARPDVLVPLVLVLVLVQCEALLEQPTTPLLISVEERLVVARVSDGLLFKS